MDQASQSRSRDPNSQNVQNPSQPQRTSTNNNYSGPIQNHEIQASHGMRENFPPYNHAINDAFNAYLHSDTETSFNHNWDPAESIQTYGATSNSWNPNVLHTTPGLLSGPDFGMQSRNFDQTYSRTQPVEYDAFPPSNPALTTSSFDPTFVPYGHLPLPDDGNFDFSHQAFRTVTRPSDTISPQALQAYPAATFSRVQIPDSRPSQKYSDQPQRAAQKPSGEAYAGRPPITSLGWRSSVSAIPKGSPRGGFLIKDPVELERATKSSHFRGFVFVGNETVELSTTKASFPQYHPRRSINGVWELLLEEKGDGPWNPARASLLKKLKRCMRRSSGSRISTSSPASQGLSTLDSTSSPESQTGSDSDEGSEYSSGSEEDLDNEAPSPLPSSRPTDPGKAVEYDATKAVWAAKNKILSADEIRSSLADYWDLMRRLRDQWKSEVTALQQAELRPENATTIQLRDSVNEKRRLIESCIRIALSHGHQDIIQRLGENPVMFLVFFQLIQDRMKANEYAGAFLSSILELMTRCTTVDQELLEKTKVDRVLQRLSKRGDKQGKLAALKILENAAAVTKQKIGQVNPSQVQGSTEPRARNNGPVHPSSERSRPSDSNVDVKQPQTNDPPAGQISQKVAKSGASTIGATSTASSKSSGLKGKKQPSGKADSNAVGKPNPAPAPIPKVKNNHVSAKPTNFFMSIQSASKKPGTSNAALLSAKVKEGKDGATLENKVPAAAGAATKPSFSFAETMANLNKQIVPEPTKPEEYQPPETAEEKVKRLRKEERRKLRVAFKPGDAIADIRIFARDEEEEMGYDREEDTGHEDSMKRDAQDRKMEGQAFKMHKERDFMDEDEDGSPEEQSLGPWRTPALADFSDIPSEERDRNSITRGGKVDVNSPERAIQQQRELSSLMVIYATPSDIPSTPREPHDPQSGEGVTEQFFGSPPPAFRKREAHGVGRQNHQFAAGYNAPAMTQTSAPDISAILSVITQSQTQSQIQPQPLQQQPIPQATTSDLEAIFAQHAMKNQQVLQPHAPQLPVHQMQMPQSTHPAQHPATTFDLQASLAAFHMPNQAQTPYGQAALLQMPDLRGLLSQFTAQPPAPLQNYAYGTGYQTADNERKRQLDYDESGGGDYRSKGKRQKNDVKKKVRLPPPQKQNMC